MSRKSESRADLDSIDNQRVQWRDWVLERLAWGVIAAVLVAAVVGVLGPGPLSRRQASSADGNVRVEYEAFLRRAAPAHLRINARPDSSAAHHVRIGISSSFIQATKMESIAPQPMAIETAGGQIIYTFAIGPGVDLLNVVFRYDPDEYGWLTYHVGAGNESVVAVRQFIFP